MEFFGPLILYIFVCANVVQCLLFQNVFSYKTGPKGKIPFIEYNDNVYSDSGFIIKHFNSELGIIHDSGLNPEQKATAHALQKMTEEHMYW